MDYNELVSFVAGILGSIVSLAVISNFVYYTKSQIDHKFKEFDKSVDNELAKAIQNFDDKILALETKLNDMIKAIYDSKEVDKNLSIDLIKVTDAMKEELRKDNIARHNDMMTIINTKVDEKDFSRLEQKFEKVAESLIELKAVIQVKSGVKLFTDDEKRN